MENAKHSGISSLARFAAGLEKDFAAVLSAVETDWSNGQVEGQINRLKTLKRQMYGRAGFELLRARALPYVPLPSSRLAPSSRMECQGHV
jgi:transposase